MILDEICKPVESHLTAFHSFFKEKMQSKVSLLDLIIRYMTRKRGKQIRPALVFLSAEICGGVNQRSYVGAAMVELLHTATLIHDDVVDEASERRGLATINSVWNNKIAVLIGDYLLGKGLLTAIDGAEFEFLRATSTAVKRMSEGELLQIQKSKEVNFNEEIYFRIISDKTASLLSACCEIGAISSCDDLEIRSILKNYGENLGIAFQIRDDIFDFIGKRKTIGKPVGNDIKEKKVTLPLIYACSNVTKKEANAILKVYKQKKIEKKDIEKIVEFVKKNNGIDLSEQKSKYYKELALSEIKNFPDSPAKKSLIDFTDFVIEREM